MHDSRVGNSNSTQHPSAHDVLFPSKQQLEAGGARFQHQVWDDVPVYEDEFLRSLSLLRLLPLEASAFQCEHSLPHYEPGAPTPNLGTDESSPDVLRCQILALLRARGQLP